MKLKERSHLTTSTTDTDTSVAAHCVRSLLNTLALQSGVKPNVMMNCTQRLIILQFFKPVSSANGHLVCTHLLPSGRTGDPQDALLCREIKHPEK